MKIFTVFLWIVSHSYIKHNAVWLFNWSIVSKSGHITRPKKIFRTKIHFDFPPTRQESSFIMLSTPLHHTNHCVGGRGWGRGHGTSQNRPGKDFVSPDAYQRICVGISTDLPINLSFCLPLCRSMYLSICLSVSLSIHPSICLPVFLFIHLSVC